MRRVTRVLSLVVLLVTCAGCRTSPPAPYWWVQEPPRYLTVEEYEAVRAGKPAPEGSQIDLAKLKAVSVTEAPTSPAAE